MSVKIEPGFAAVIFADGCHSPAVPQYKESSGHAAFIVPARHGIIGVRYMATCVLGGIIAQGVVRCVAKSDDPPSTTFEFTATPTGWAEACERLEAEGEAEGALLVAANHAMRSSGGCTYGDHPADYCPSDCYDDIGDWCPGHCDCDIAKVKACWIRFWKSGGPK